MKVLVADDNHDAALSLGMLVELLGHEVRTAFDGIEALQVAGEFLPDMVLLDIGMPRMDGYEAARRIGAGCTLTYGEIASEIGMPGAARAVGQALGRNPFPIIIPCHRVVAAGGKLGGFSAHGGTATKMRLLAIERAATGATRDAKR